MLKSTLLELLVLTRTKYAPLSPPSLFFQLCGSEISDCSLTFQVYDHLFFLNLIIMTSFRKGKKLNTVFVLLVGGVVTLVLVVLCLVWVGVASEVGFHANGRALDFTRLPLTIGIYSFCYGSHSVFPNIYSSMREPSRFPSVLVIR